jgi:hypothetical protein
MSKPLQWKAIEKAWARFETTDEFGYPKVDEVRVRFWRLNGDGKTVGLVPHEKGMVDASSFPNFIGYRHAEDYGRG